MYPYAVLFGITVAQAILVIDHWREFTLRHSRLGAAFAAIGISAWPTASEWSTSSHTIAYVLLLCTAVIFFLRPARSHEQGNGE